jgi:hypothetical protein
MNNVLHEGDDFCNKAMDTYKQSLRAANVIQLADNVYVPNISPDPSKLKYNNTCLRVCVNLN